MSGEQKMNCDHDWEQTDWVFAPFGLLFFPTARKCKKCGVNEVFDPRGTMDPKALAPTESDARREAP